MLQSYDLAIVGGGMSGLTAALCYSQLGLKIALIEANEPQNSASPSFDQRAIALSASSVAIFKSLGIWDSLSALACPIERIHVSDQGKLAFTRLNAEDYGLSALGEVVPLEAAGPKLWQQLNLQSGVTQYCPARLHDYEINDDEALLSIECDDSSKNAQVIRISARLIIAADGTFSKVAAMGGMDYQRHAYQQQAIIANIETEKHHCNRAFERFTENGPLALLPLSNNQSSLVWCHHPEHMDEMKGLDDAQFIEQLQREFGYRLGKIKRVSQRYHYPLSLHIASLSFSNRVLLLGNSAHTLHPIAGQGFNLGLRDIAVLNDCFIEAIQHCQDFGSASFLNHYTQMRHTDWQQTILATDGLARLFSHSFLPLQCLRQSAMNWVNRLPLIKAKVASAAMGFDGRSSRLARGIANPQKTLQDQTCI